MRRGIADSVVEAAMVGVLIFVSTIASVVSALLLALAFIAWVSLPWLALYAVVHLIVSAL